jgi:hypothetical protein
VTRSISHTEASALLDCQAKHDFGYVDQLAGSSLKPLTTHYRLRQGKAWGRAMATYHGSIQDPHAVIDASLAEDAEQMMLVDQDELDEMTTRLHACFDHYAAETDRLLIDRQELKLDVQIPSRTGKRRSNLYRFTGYIDGIQTDPHGRDWIVEFKFRDDLSTYTQVALGRQTRWYAWAWRETTGRSVAGVIVDERRTEAPKPARWVNSKRKSEGLVPSHAKDQMTTPGLYAAACREHGEEPQEEVLAALAARKWQDRHVVFLSDRELDEVGLQLTSVAHLAAQFDSRVLFPVRNPSQFRCPSCAFREICANPQDADLVDALYERVPAKKDRQEVAA